MSFLDILKSLQSAAKEDSVLVFGKLEELISRLLVLMETGNVSSRIDALKKRRCVNRFRHSTRATENSCSSSLCEEDFLDVGGRFVVVADNDGTSLYDQFLYGIYTVLKIVFAILLKMDATSIVNFNETLKTVAFRGVLLFYQTIKMLAPVITALVAPCSSSSSKPKKNDIDDVVVASIAPSASTALLPLLNSAVSARRNSKAAAVAADESSFSASTNDSSEMDWMAECIIFLHQILGKRQLCTMDNGAILKTEVAYLAGLDDQHYHRELYQCYYCIYGIYVKVDNEVHIDEHHVSEHQTFDRDCATEVFNAVADYIQEKIDSKSYRGISNDVRSCLDKIAAVFTTPPWENAKVSRNKEFINRYLSSDIDPLEPAPDRGLAIKELAHFGAADRSKISGNARLG